MPLCLRRGFPQQMSSWETQRWLHLPTSSATLQQTPRQAGGYQHCEAVASESAVAAAAAVCEFVTAGHVGLSVVLRLEQSWCDVCFVLGR